VTTRPIFRLAKLMQGSKGMSTGLIAQEGKRCVVGRHRCGVDKIRISGISIGSKKKRHSGKKMGFAVNKY